MLTLPYVAGNYYCASTPSAPRHSGADPRREAAVTRASSAPSSPKHSFTPTHPPRDGPGDSAKPGSVPSRPVVLCHARRPIRCREPAPSFSVFLALGVLTQWSVEYRRKEALIRL
ncbi:hypothetical protein C8Q80DRAFT_781649 [Daedaleopsis nitida]|nr:hypothetical protein C8Q80DRAFT_781649 [Daedaleopsis nitida]